MGLFLVATAIRDAAADDIAAAVESWCSDHFVTCSDVTGKDAAVSDRIDIFAPINGWTMVMLPGNFIPFEEIATYLAGRLSAVLSVVSVYDSDCWEQVTINKAQIVDRYATDPRYLTSDLEPLSVVAPRWQGDPQAVADLLGCDAREVARHYRRNRRNRTFDEWNFVELWATEGITYAEPSAAIDVTLTLGEDWFAVLDRLTRR